MKSKIQHYLPLVTFLIQGMLLLAISPLGVDPHHDGIIFGAAISFSEGAVPNKDAFTQYGPFSPIIQGLFLDATSGSLLMLRYFTALNVLLISITLYKVSSLINSKSTALIISSYWVFTAAIWSTSFNGSLIPWPSLIATEILLLALFVLMKYDQTNKKHRFYPYFTGVLIAVAGFTRIQTWLVLILICSVFLILRRARIARKVLVGFVITIASSILVMFAMESVWDYINQAVVWPLIKYPSLGHENNFNLFHVYLCVIETIICLCVLVAQRLASAKISKGINFATCLLVCSSILIGMSQLGKNSEPGFYQLLFVEPLDRILMAPTYLSLTVPVVMIGFALTRSVRQWLLKDSELLLLLAFSLMGVFQLYPLTDVLHIWWISPLTLPFLFGLTSKINKTRNLINKKAAQKSLITLSVLGLILGMKYLFAPWVPHSTTALKGTFSSQPVVDEVNFFSQIEEKSIYKNSSFDCRDGIYSVLDGRYNARDKWFVNWGQVHGNIQEPGEIRFICNKSVEYLLRESNRLNMKIISYDFESRTGLSLGIMEAKHLE